MAISSAIQKGGYVYVYDERGHNTCQLQAGSGPPDGLVGYTGNTVSIRRGNNVYTYDGNGKNLFEKRAAK